MPECIDCISYEVCKVAQQPICWSEGKFRHFKNKDNFLEIQHERESKIIEAYRHIGDTVYSAIFNAPGEEPHLESEKICYVEIGSDRIDFYGECETFIAEFDDVGKWNHDRLSSFSQSDIEEEIEKWWKKKLGLD